jgi:hypothetical protein
MDNLRKQHVIVIDNCCMCKRNGKFVDHLFLHCEVSCALRNFFFFFFVFGCLGFCLDEWLTCLLVDELLEALGVLLC